MKPHVDPFAIITTPPPQDLSNNKQFWPFDTLSSRVFPSLLQRSFINFSSQICDLDDKDDAPESILEENYGVDKQKPLVVHNCSKFEQPSKPARKNELRVSDILLDQGLFNKLERLRLNISNLK